MAATMVRPGLGPRTRAANEAVMQGDCVAISVA
jgi:hypothetical protein